MSTTNNAPTFTGDFTPEGNPIYASGTAGAHCAPVAGSVWPADGNLVQVAQHMHQCGIAWEAGARLIGNCRATDIAAIALHYLALIETLEDIERSTSIEGIFPDEAAHTLQWIGAHAREALAPRND